MSFQCYTPRTSLRSALTGGLFISCDGTRRVIPDHCLQQAELLNGSRFLRFSYSCCTIEVSGQGLDPVFEDASIGKLGAIQAVPPGPVPTGQLWVTSIVIVPLPQSPFSASGEGSFDD
jgi:hypothetical protein